MAAAVVDRLRRAGDRALSAAQGVALFDAALRTGEAVVVPARLNLPAIRARGAVPALLRGSVPVVAAAPATPVPPRDTLDLVRAEIAAVLGHSVPVAPDTAFGELGFDSLTGLELRNRLAAATGIRLSATLVFDHPTPAELARHLDQGLGGEPVGSSRPDTLATLYRKVCEAGEFVAAMHLLVTASWALPTFGAADSRAHALAPTLHRAGGEGPLLVCFPSFVPDVAEYGPLVQLLPVDTLLIPHPGFVGSAVPRDWETLVALHTETVLAQIGDRRFVVVGRSAGGRVAHAVATRLRALGRPPAGLVLLDTYQVDAGNIADEWLLSLPWRSALRLGERFDDAVAELGAYTRIFLDWRPSPTDLPTLLVRASEPVGDPGSTVDWQARWPLPCDVVDVAGDHFTLLEDQVPATAAAVMHWVSRLDEPRVLDSTPMREAVPDTPHPV